MLRENNNYINKFSGEILNATEFNQFVRSETKRQYEECSGEKYNSLIIDEQEECVLEQYKHQLDTDWMVATNYKIIKGFPTYKEVLTAYNELFKKIKDITTIEQALEYQNNNMITVEINGMLIEHYVKNEGTDTDIEWIRYEEINYLAYIYCWIKNGKVSRINFDVYCDWSEDEFLDHVSSLTQEQYYQAIEKHIELFKKSECEVIGYDTEELPDIKFVA